MKLSYIILLSITNKDQIFSINLCPYAFFSKRNKSTTYIVKNFIINTYNRILTFVMNIKHQKISFTNTRPPQKNDLENLVVESIKNEFEEEFFFYQ